MQKVITIRQVLFMTPDQIEQYMMKALTKAEDAGSKGEIPVGAVIVHNDTVIASNLIPIYYLQILSISNYKE
jgi:hypothetical protein